ncbi:hypothetical protein [Polyangium jinanense]|uniref:Uncharacterized protein n=1 Tax=Polyangium jinanense TaxID=2829994 RepID=A0A9X4AXI9_9BACT|nr:hypothetical protein [Polyangium jinanense]MDC3959650.1 hypothetical protein [Polyangium jinanense]MDC3988571.1 hypothetical protein [Polyangium jinanense]MDC3988613.1 hypothetical protein [Polyangium jinanense]
MATSRLSTFVRQGRRHVALTVLGAAALATFLPRGIPNLGAKDRSTALASALASQGLVLTADDVAWIDPPRGVWGALGAKSRAVVRAAPAQGEPNDLYLVHAELSPEGVLLDVGGAYNLTETSGADESRPVVRGERLAYVSSPLIAGSHPTVHVFDLSGQALATEGWTRVERLQNALTNAQETGQLRGIGKRTFTLGEGEGEAAAQEAEPKEGEAPARDVRCALEEATLVVRDGTREARVPLDGPATLPAWLSHESGEIARPGNVVTWSVDRVRDVIGDEAMQTIKAVAFAGLEVVMRQKESMGGEQAAAEAIAEDLGQTTLEAPTRTMPTDPEIGWPPAPLDPWITPALPGEGQWNPQDKDPFIRRIEGLPPAFVTTYIRPDRSRKTTRVFIVVWDPRQVELHMMAGTVEPKGATGEAGPGLIPRDPAVLERVVAASNAGFQALHGEFGMMADGVVYLPPKPYGATVAVLRDGSTAFGSWPEDQSIPPNVMSYRQNMTVMVLDEKFNPYNRSWWGGTPPGWADKTHTVRTGICLTKEKFVAYFYGADLGPEGLAQAMIQTRCSYGIALDMNAGHSGLEFYKVAQEGEMDPLGRPLQYDWESEGTVSGIDGWKFRGRRFIRGMGLMNFPRYIKREARDYFYMTLRHVLPGPGITPVAQPPVDGEGQWRVKGLPQHGFPYALASTELRIDAARPDRKARVVKIDPRTVAAAKASAQSAGKTVAVLDAGPADAGAGSASLWASAGAFAIGAESPVEGAVRLATGSPNAAVAAAAVGVNDKDGMLLYVELLTPADASAADAKALDALLKNAGCSTRLLLAKPLAVALGGDTDLAGAAVHPPQGPTAVRLARAEAPGGRRFLEDTPIVPFDKWYPLQQKRIRYFKKPQKDPAEGASN